MNITRIRGDLKSIYKLINPVPSDEAIVDVAAYLTQQAIEKSLKYILSNVYGESEESKDFKIHSITKLIKKISVYDNNFKKNNKDLVKNAIKLTSWEANARYSNSICSNMKDVKCFLKIAEKLYQDISVIECSKNPLYIKELDFHLQ